jgi:cell division protein FtsW
MAGDDMGTTALLSLMMLTMIYMAGAPSKKVVTIGGVGALAGVSLLLLGDGFRLRRLMAFLHPDDYKLSEAWQLHQSQIGLASGGLFGSGPGYSRAKWGYLGPEAHTDFIFPVLGEELGRLGVSQSLGPRLGNRGFGPGVGFGGLGRSEFGHHVRHPVAAGQGVNPAVRALGGHAVIPPQHRSHRS